MAADKDVEKGQADSRPSSPAVSARGSVVSHFNRDDDRRPAKDDGLKSDRITSDSESTFQTPHESPRPSRDSDAERPGSALRRAEKDIERDADEKGTGKEARERDVEKEDDVIEIEAFEKDVEKEACDKDIEREACDKEIEREAALGEAGPAVVSRQQSRASRASRASVISRSPLVPRAERRGLFGRFTILPETERPYDYDNKIKWGITAIVAIAGVASPTGSSLLYPALPEIVTDLHTKPTIANFTVAFYMLAMGVFPLWWSSFSENLGRRSIYLVSFSLFAIFGVLSAVSSSIAMLIAMRVLGGGASASVQAVGAGTIADIWEPRERGRAMGIFYLGPLMGPLLAPIIGGALTAKFDWRSTMWFLTIYGGVTLLLILFFLPETLTKRPAIAPAAAAASDAVLPTRSREAAASTSNTASRAASRASRASRATSAMQSARYHSRRLVKATQKCVVEPLSVVLYLRFPPVALTVAYAALTFGALFVLNVALQATFAAPPYSFRPLSIGLLYIAPSLGYIAASVAGGPWVDRIAAREAARRGGRMLPEDRMRENAWLAATLFPAALAAFGWAAGRGAPWPAPAAAAFCFGLGSMLVFGAATTMLTEFMPRRSSAGVAVNNLVRNVFSCTGTIIAQPALSAIGSGWLCTIVALVCWLGGNLCIWLLRHNAAKWREQMDRQFGTG